MEEQLIAEIARCEQDIRRGSEDLARLKEALRSLRRQKPSTDEPSGMDEANQSHRARGNAASTIRSFVRKELRSAGRPLNRVEILERMEGAGIKIESKVPVKRIGKVLWNCREFQHVGDGYWFAGETIPLSGDDQTLRRR